MPAGVGYPGGRRGLRRVVAAASPIGQAVATGKAVGIGAAKVVGAAKAVGAAAKKRLKQPQRLPPEE
jgi:hypothetical protein